MRTLLARPLLAALLLSAGLLGCRPVLYAPDSHPTPLLTEAGGVQVAPRLGALTGPTDSTFMVEAGLQAAASPIRHLGVFGAAAYSRHPDHHHRYAEGGVLFYGGPPALRWEALLGIGAGDVEAKGNAYDFYLGLDPYTATADYTRLFAQANAWRQIDEEVALGLSLRGSRVRFTGVMGLRVGLEPVREIQAFYLEPALFLRLGEGPVAGEVQVLWSHPLAVEYDEAFSSRLLFVGGGAVVSLDRLFHRSR